MRSTAFNLCFLLCIGTTIVQFVVLMPIAANANAAFCEPGWQYFRDNCYKVFNEKRTQRGASNFCEREHHAQLVSIHSRAENSFVHDLLDFADPSHSEHFWIGLQMERMFEDHVSDCQWTDGSAVQFGCPKSINNGNYYQRSGQGRRDYDEYSSRGKYPWARYSGYPPEPNNWGPVDEACVVVGHNTGVTRVCRQGWVDWRCDSMTGFVCKKKAEEITGADDFFDDDC